jgi:hypothetical protein
MSLLRDDSAWPVVVDTCVAPLSDADVRRYNETRAERLARAERHVQVMDGRHGPRMSPGHRAMIAAFDAEHLHDRERYLAGVALVTTSLALRMLLAVIYRMTPSVCPRKPCGSLEEATAWARGLLARP